MGLVIASAAYVLWLCFLYHTAPPSAPEQLFMIRLLAVVWGFYAIVRCFRLLTDKEK